MKLNVGLIGYGYWGPNLARNVFNHPYLNLLAIADLKSDKQEIAQNQYPNSIIYTNSEQLLNNSQIDIVIIATSVKYHFNLAKLALENNKHVLLEKPACASHSELKELSDLAKINNLVLMVDYTFLYNGAIKKIKDLVVSEDFGKINYIDGTRINLGIFQNDVNVLWDLASHDIAITNHLIGELPSTVKANGICHTKNGIENIAYLTLGYSRKNIIVHFNCSWTSPVKIRQMLIGGDKKMIIYNDIEPTDKIKVYECNFNFEGFNDKKDVLIDYRLGDISIPKFDTKEPLVLLIDDLYNSLINKVSPISSCEVALNVSKVLEAAQESMKKNGIEVRV